MPRTLAVRLSGPVRGRMHFDRQCRKLGSPPFIMIAGAHSFEDGDLLSESQNLQRKVTPTAEEDADDSEDGKDGFDHELTVIT